MEIQINPGAEPSPLPWAVGCKLLATKATERGRHEGRFNPCPHEYVALKIIRPREFRFTPPPSPFAKDELSARARNGGKELQYRIDHTYANDPKRKKYSFVMTRAVRLGTRLAGGENYDPFLLVLREIETGNEQVLPTFWAHGKSNTERGGQFPPLLSLEEWKTLFRRLDASFDALEERIQVRAHQLYEQRGKQHGHALDDWLQAEAELTERKSLRAAA